MDDISHTIKPKSDQLNADDLIAGPITVTITAVKEGPSEQQPVALVIDGGHMPYLPCKSMRRVLVEAWTANAKHYIGKRLTLFADKNVAFGGAKVGGIRISHMSGIDQPLAAMLTTTRSNRSPFIVQPLTVEMYPADRFASKLPAMRKAIVDGTMTADQVITRCRKVGELSEDQVRQIKGEG